MSQIISYLTFNGNCREAMTFYKECLGVELSFQTIEGSSFSEKMPRKMKRCILHSTLINESLVIMATDCVKVEGLIKGNAVSLCLNCNSINEIKTFYKKLAAEGRVDQPLKKTFWGAIFGSLKDKYGHHWLLNYSK